MACFGIKVFSPKIQSSLKVGVDGVRSAQIEQNKKISSGSLLRPFHQRKSAESEQNQKVSHGRLWPFNHRKSAQIEQSQMESYQSTFNQEKSAAPIHIQQELEEMQSNPSNEFMCLPLPGNVYECVFGIIGPKGTAFDGGIYIGSILFSEEYPKKHPRFTFLTENGLIQTRTEIGLGNYPSFGVRNTLHTLIGSFRQKKPTLIESLLTFPNGALRSVECNKEEEWRALAIESQKAPPKFWTAEHQKLCNQIHKDLLSKATLVPSNSRGDIQKLECNKEEEWRALAIESQKASPKFWTPEHQKLGNQIHKDLLSKATLVPSNSGGNIQASSQNDLDNKEQAIYIFSLNNIFADHFKDIGFSSIGNIMRRSQRCF